MSKIEWTDRSDWNPIRGCTRVSEGCRNCYAERIAARFSDPGQPFHGFATRTAAGGRWTGKVELIKERLDFPLRWRKPARIFVNSTHDLFHESVQDEWIDRVFAVMALAPQHTFQVLTKRPERMLEWFLERWQGTPAQTFLGMDIPAGGETGRMSQVEYACEPLIDKFGLADPGKSNLWTAGGRCRAMQWQWPLPNVWLGVSIEDQPTADERIPLLLKTPAAVRFVSAEPLLGPVSFRVPFDGAFVGALRGARPGIPSIDWVIAGGESGPGARPAHPDWFRSLRDQCQVAVVPFFFKQWGEWAPNCLCDTTDAHAETPRPSPGLPGCMFRCGKRRAGRLLDDRIWDQFPEAAP